MLAIEMCISNDNNSLVSAPAPRRRVPDDDAVDYSPRVLAGHIPDINHPTVGLQSLIKENDSMTGILINSFMNSDYLLTFTIDQY